MKIQLLRHATLVIEYADHKILVDPMLSPAEAMEPVANASNSYRIPMVELPIGNDALSQLLGEIDLMLVTHTHRDHWDNHAVEHLPKNIALRCQPADLEKIQQSGFTAVAAIDLVAEDWQGIQISRTSGQHGTGEIGQLMGVVSGFVLQAPNEPTLYIAGDTIWCDEVAAAITTYHPHVIIVNAGAAQFLKGDPITMTAEDIIQVCQATLHSQVVAVHMDTVNHCHLKRPDLQAALAQTPYHNQVAIPADGESLVYDA